MYLFGIFFFFSNCEYPGQLTRHSTRGCVFFHCLIIFLFTDLWLWSYCFGFPLFVVFRVGPLKAELKQRKVYVHQKHSRPQPTESTRPEEVCHRM